MQDKKPVIYNTSRFRSCYEAWGKNLMACISFDTKEGEEVIVKTSISAVSTKGACANLRELDGLTFDALKAKGEDLWENELAKYTLKADRKKRKKLSILLLIMQRCIRLFFKMPTDSIADSTRTWRKLKVLRTIPFSPCGIRIGLCILGLIWFIRM